MLEIGYKKDSEIIMKPLEELLGIACKRVSRLYEEKIREIERAIEGILQKESFSLKEVGKVLEISKNVEKLLEEVRKRLYWEIRMALEGFLNREVHGYMYNVDLELKNDSMAISIWKVCKGKNLMIISYDKKNEKVSIKGKYKKEKEYILVEVSRRRYCQNRSSIVRNIKKNFRDEK